MTKKINTQDLVKEALTKLLKLMGSQASFELSQEEDTIVVNIEAGEETGLLIGRQGETLSSVQTILATIIRAQVGEWQRIVVNVGDWKEKQEDKLKELALQAAQRAVDTGEAQPIYNLTPAQRRVIHMELSETPEIQTESEGEGSDRYLVVKPKATKGEEKESK
jgi:spoIIIJ-associated protein